MRKKIKKMRLGLEGEKVVGQELEKLRTQGCMVFHDIVGENFNIDHVVISDKGIFLIETKTYSKPNLVNPKVNYKNGKLVIDGLGDMSKIINQVKASSTWLKRTLEESTGKIFLIKPVILFPGWYVNSPEDSEIWVLEPKQFPYYLSKKKEIVSREDKKLAAFHLSRYIRAL
ncbi:MAG: NERD domain-containing protein [Candidatus Marinimicrobia bacterium]|nr:NERD domain-containing protein [Candidatus Neomarinimicrobiota bacterium]